MATELTQDWEEFLRHKIEVGEIYSHLKTLTGVKEIQRSRFSSRMYAYGLFVAFYSPGPAYVYWRYAPTGWNRHEIEDWMTEHWSFLRPHAKERLMPGCGRVEKMYECIRSVAEIANNITISELKGDYEKTFNYVKQAKHIGRYMAIRWANAIAWDPTGGLPRVETMHAKGGKAIRQPLHMVTGKLPDWAEESSWQKAEIIGRVEQSRLKSIGIDLSRSELSEMLCDFKRMVNGKHYTGIQLADRLPQIKGAMDAGFDMEPILESRRRQFNYRYLSELWDPPLWEPQDHLKTHYRDTGEEWRL